ncbi:MAG: PH domain-containing protein [Candidatus Nanohaloarchaea archaeon]
MAEEFDWLSPEEGEEVLWSGKPRIKSIIPAVAVGIPMIPVFGAGLLVIAGAYLNVKNTDYVVTSLGVYQKSGVLSRNVQKIGFDKIQNISFSQGIFGNYFGYGNVEISTAGSSGTEMAFRSIEEPKKIQELINRRIGEDPGKKQQGDFKQQVLEELEKINKQLKSIDEKL